MLKIYRLFLLTGILCVLFSLSGFSQYSALNGKWVQINGPSNYKTLGVCHDEKTCDRLIYILENGDKEDFNYALKSFKILRVENNTKAIVTDIDITGNKARVTIFTGLHQGHSGWIPLAWLGGNYERPVLSKKYDATLIY